MAGRGRGQPFQAISDGLGIGRGQINQQHVDPPPIYPPLGSRPHYPQMLPENEYMLAVMKDFTNNMRDSQFAISASDKDNLSKGIVIERHSDKPHGFVQKPLIGIDWKRFPKELAPSSARNKTKRKGGASSTLKPNLLSPKKKSKTLTIHPDDVLDKLEKAEKNGTKEGGDGNEGSDAEGSDKEDEDAEKIDEELMDEEDEELDEGTDYANNFFDNGENYLDDDEDNLDEGGIY